MSKILFACFKDSKPIEFSKDNINLLSNRLEPDNITFRDTRIISTEKELIAIFNPNDSLKIEKQSVCLGNMINPCSTWNEPKSQIPDGTFALFRSSSTCIEIISDMLATRTIWYYHDENKFISATSQRAIIFFLRSFHFNKQVLPWMLANGTLGPGLSWDSRIKMLEGDSVLSLDRQNWKLKIESNSCVFRLEQRTKQQHYETLKNAIVRSFKSLELDYTKWILPLSGGYDSRAILCMLKDEEDLTCVTWGMEESKYQKGNDAFVARELADHFGKKHNYYLTNLSNEPVNKIFNRFLVCGEGRVGDIAGYLDGFKIWKDLFESGVQGIIRGDEGFGARSVISQSDIRRNMRSQFLSDYSNLNEIHKLGIPVQEVPDWLQRIDGESLESWRDRVYYTYEIPHAFAALNDLKLSFVEVINPLLTREILSVVKSLPDDLRTSKKLFRDIIHDIGPNIDFASKEATAFYDNIFNNNDICEEIKNVIESYQDNSVIPPQFIKFIISHIKFGKESSISKKISLKNKLKILLPSRIKNLLRNTIINNNMDYRIMAFRTYIIIKMNSLLIEDSLHSDNIF